MFCIIIYCLYAKNFFKIAFFPIFMIFFVDFSVFFGII